MDSASSMAYHGCTDEFSPGFRQDMRNTLRQLLYHAAMSIWLLIRLSTLPALHALSTLSKPRAPLTDIAMNLFGRLVSTIGTCVPESIRQQPLIHEGTRRTYSLYLAVRRATRIFRALYVLGSLLDQNPELLGSRRPSTICQGSGVQRRYSMFTPGHNLTYHATASQIYHAALAENDNTLDDLLAGFAEAANVTTLNESRDEPSASAVPDCQECSRRTRYRNSSIQTTPERMHTVVRSRKAGDEKHVDALTDEVGPEDKKVPTASSWASEMPNSTTRPKVSYSTTDLTAMKSVSQIEEDDSKSSASHGSSHGPEGCPREVTRQAQSRWPRNNFTRTPDGSPVRNAGSSKRASGARSSTLTPTRQRKLQRRVRSPEL
jgi:hypothetical protein